VRWTRTVNFAPGVYRFTLTADDGVQLYIDDDLKIDGWYGQPPATYTTDIYISGGFHDVLVDYFESTGGALAQLSWENLSDPNCYASVPFGHWRGEFYGNTNLTGDPLIVRDYGDSFLNFDIGDGSPGAACGVGADNFSARWVRTVYFPIGRYRFTVTADDGVRLWVGGKLIINKWLTQGPTTYTGDVFLYEGFQDIWLEYFESGGAALARVSWETLSGSNCYATVPIEHWIGKYFNNPEHTGDPERLGDPLIVRDDGDNFLNFDIGDGSPGAACGVGADNFSVIWYRRINVPPGNYRFNVTVDDGVRLRVDGNLVIDKWFVQPPTTYTANVYLGRGDHLIVLYYFEAGGGALARLNWTPISGP
jgi:hypothetical protein